MALKWNEIASEIIVGTGVGVATTVILSIPCAIGYGIYSWWNNKDARKAAKSKKTKTTLEALNESFQKKEAEEV